MVDKCEDLFYLLMLVDVDDGLQVGLASHSGHGDVVVDCHGGLLVAHQVEGVGRVVAQPHPDGPRAVCLHEKLLGVLSINSGYKYWYYDVRRRT